MNKLKLILSLITSFSCFHQVEASSKKKCLVENIGYDLANLNPHSVNDFSKMRVFDDLFEGLVRYNQNGEIVSGCASHWDISEDRRTYTFHLRPEAKWSNGDALTAEDFVFAWRSAVDPKNPIKYFSFLFDDIVNAKEIRNGEKKLEDLGIRAIDNHTFEIKLISPNAMFLNFLCLGIFFPIHKASVETLGLTYGFTPEQTVGNGAYMLKEFIHNGHILLKKNPNYWDQENVKLKKVKFVMLQDAFTDMQAFDSKSIDITHKSLPIRGENFYKEKYQDLLQEYPILSQDLLVFNLDNDKFREVAVRKALTMAIDKKLYIEKIIKLGDISYNPILETLGEKFKEVYNEMPEYAWTKYKFDKCAIEADWLLDDFFTEEKPLKVTITYPIGTFYKNIAEFIQNSWRQVFKNAVQVKVEAKLEKDLLESLYKGDFEICLSNVNAFYPSPMNFASFYVSDKTTNFSRYKNPDFDKIFYSSLTKTGQDLLDAQVELSKMLLKDFVSIPLFSLPVMKLVNREVGGFCCEKNILNRYSTKDLFFINKTDKKKSKKTKAKTKKKKVKAKKKKKESKKK